MILGQITAPPNATPGWKAQAARAGPAGDDAGEIPAEAERFAEGVPDR